MLGILNRKISTRIGLIVVLIIALLAGWLMIKQYKALMEMRLAPLDLYNIEKEN